MILLQNASGAKNKPMLPAEIARALPHGILTVGRRGSPGETHTYLDGLADTGAMCSTYKLSIMMDYCKAYPHHVEEIIDSGDGNFKAVPLAGAVGDSKVLPSLSTFLPVIVILFTPWVRTNGSPVYLSFACGEALSIRCIIGMPMLMDMGPAVVDLASRQIICPNYDVQQIPVMLKEPNDDPLNLANALPHCNKMAQAVASANVKGVHAAVNSIMIRHVNPVLDVRANGISTPGYGGFNSKVNPIFDPMVTMATKMESLDLDPVIFVAPEVVCETSNRWYYPSSKFGHNSPSFRAHTTPFSDPGT